MNTFILSAAVVSTLGLGTQIAHANDYKDYATVISATPIYTPVSTPRQQCWNEQVSSYEERQIVHQGYSDRADYNRQGSNAGGALLGAILGGVIGHQFGESTGGRDRGTAAGAILGGVIGANASRNNDNNRNGNYQRARVEIERIPVVREVQRCNTVAEYRQEISGYDVHYRYHDREYNTRMAYDPGRTLPINVEVRPNTANSGQFGDNYNGSTNGNYQRDGQNDRLRDRRQPVPSYSRVY